MAQKLILAYNFSPARLQALKPLCMMLKSQLRGVAKEELGLPVGYLAGVKGVGPVPIEMDEQPEAAEPGAASQAGAPVTTQDAAAAVTTPEAAADPADATATPVTNLEAGPAIGPEAADATTTAVPSKTPAPVADPYKQKKVAADKMQELEAEALQAAEAARKDVNLAVEMVFLCGFAQSDLNRLLTGIRKSPLKSVALKAVLTPNNATWSGGRLLREIAAEEAYMRKYMELKQALKAQNTPK